jgi:hypothetical protein
MTSEYVTLCHATSTRLEVPLDKRTLQLCLNLATPDHQPPTRLLEGLD